MRKAIVTGANGFVGTALCTELSGQGVQVIAVIKDKNENINAIKDLPQIRIVYCEMSDFRKLGELISDPDVDVFYHLAWVGCSGALRADSDVQTDNIRYTCDTVKACNDIGCKRFVFASSIMEYETDALMKTESTPSVNTIYSSAKKAADYMARALAGGFGTAYIRALISNIYGAGERSPRLINTSIRKLLNNEHCAFSAGEQLYDFIYITDAAKIFVALGEKGKANKTYYIGSSPRPLKDFLLDMRDVAAPGAEIGLGELPFDGVSLSYDEFDIHAVYEDTEVKPEISFKEGIEKTTEWIKEEKIMAAFNIKPIDIGGYIIDNFFADDNRGSFTKLFEQKIFAEQGVKFQCSESFVSRSDKNVVRGMHFQTFHPQAKLVSVLSGKIFDVIIDLRKESDTYGQWRGFYLSSENHKGLLVPGGFAHGFLSLENNTEVLYQCDGAYDKDTDTGIIFSDKDVGIKWPADISSLIVGERDKELMTFKEFDAEYSFTYGEIVRGGGITALIYRSYFLLPKALTAGVSL